VFVHWNKKRIVVLSLLLFPEVHMFCVTCRKFLFLILGARYIIISNFMGVDVWMSLKFLPLVAITTVRESCHTFKKKLTKLHWFSFIVDLSNVEVERLAFPFYIMEFLSSNIGTETEYPDGGLFTVFSLPSRKQNTSVANRVLYNSLLTNYWFSAWAVWPLRGPHQVSNGPEKNNGKLGGPQ
jgi:hypothetical protein